jgi:hypothetical protein
MNRESLLARIALALIVVTAGIAITQRGSAQVETATLQGTVLDPQGAVIPQAQVTVMNLSTSASRSATTSDSGEFTLVGLAPGTYTVRVQREGFKSSEASGIVLSVGSRQSISIHLDVGSATQTVTVMGGDISLLTTSPSVSSVVSRQEVANMPLNGRSFQDLMLMVPGTATVNPQLGEDVGQSSKENGVTQITVNGNTGYSNSYTIDGVSANIGAGNNGGFLGVGGSGGLPAQTILGTTQSLVPVDDLQEFRVETNGYAAEYGGYSGGQFVFVTRSGTNQFHGSASDYLRNTAFDANDWFNNHYAQPRQPLHQNDFDGSFGGPFWIPRIYDGRKKTFFFANYEGLRANIPIAAYQQYTPDAALVASTTGVIHTFLASLPKPTPGGHDYGDGLADYITGYPSPNSLNTYNVRMDQVLTSKEVFFARVSDTRSSLTGHYYGGAEPLEQNTRSYTVGLTSSFSSSITNQLRANFSSNTGKQAGYQTAQPGQPTFDAITANGYPASIPQVYASVGYYPSVGSIWAVDYRGVNSARQFDFPDNITFIIGNHQLKAGMDFRRLTSTALPESPLEGAQWYSSATLIANVADYIFNYSYSATFPSIVNFAAYAQDQWQISHRLSLSYGLRWDLTPPPTERRGGMPYTLTNQNSLANLALGSPSNPYNTYYYDFGPRLGATYLMRSKTGFETQLRGGIGIFYDAASNQGNTLLGLNSPGFSSAESLCPYSYCNVVGNFSIPLPTKYLYAPIQYPPVPPFTGTYYAISPHFTNPYTIQSNMAVQQDLGANNAVIAEYVGAFYRKGIEYRDYYVQPLNPNFQFVEFETNGLRTAYNAAQVTFEHRLSNGLFAYAGYTWSHAITQNQINPFSPYEKGNSGSDLRNNFNAFVTWDIPSHLASRAAAALLSHWGMDVRFMARGGFPIILYGQNVSDAAAGGQQESPGLNFVTGQPHYLYSKTIPGGKQLNPAAFTPAPIGQNGTVPLNYFRGPSLDQWNLAIRRDFPVYETLHLQFRAESFNLFNHPAFGYIDNTLSDVNFGQAQNTLAGALTTGNTGGVFQSGGPRNLQFALKILF